MPPESAFLELIRSVRQGDPEAVRELVERYGPHVRRIARHELRDARLRRLVDSEDVWQSVAAIFFLRMASGELEVSTPEDLTRLLSEMARNRARGQLERHLAGKRNYKRTLALDSSNQTLVAKGPSPSSIALHKETLHELLLRLSPEEREIAGLRAKGLSWEAISRRTGQRVDSARKKLSRAVARVSNELGLGDGSDT